MMRYLLLAVGFSALALPAAAQDVAKPERLLVLPVLAEDDADKVAAEQAYPKIVEAYRGVGRFEVLTWDAIASTLPAEVVDDAGEGCAKLTCARAVAEAAKVDFVGYSAFTPSPNGRLFELKVFSRAAGRPVIKANAEAPNSSVIVPAMGAVVAQAIPEKVEEKKPEAEGDGDGADLEDEEPGLFDSILLVNGVAVMFIGAFAIAWGVAHVATASAQIATPEVDARLKKTALDWWWVGLVAGGGGVAAIVVGAGLAGVGVALEAME